MLAYDLDGIFINDFHITDFENLDVEDLLSTRNKLQPLFLPEDDFIVITGRPMSDLSHTLSWFDTFFTNKPLKIFHENDDFSKAKEYKLSVLKNIKTEFNVQAFIESDKKQVDYLKQHISDIEIYHFAELISKKLQLII